jgi:hypothetical protein
MVTRMTEERFEAFGMWCRGLGTREALANCSFFSADNERLIGAAYYIRKTDAFAYVLLARDAHGRFQAFANIGPHWSLRGAEAALIARLGDLEANQTPDVPMRQDTRVGVDLFATVAKARLNPKFVNLRDGRNPSAAREYLREMSRWVVDLDGNLVKDFQTTGFDSRTWELYLFAAFKSLDFGMDRSDAVPDFRLTKGEAKVFVEAVTANATGNVEFDITKPPPGPPEDFWRYIENEMPQKFGSPLRSKLKKRYWERNDVSGHPFVIAIADFHSPGSMIWSHTALPLYLYGIGVDIRYGKDGSKHGVERKAREHVVGGKVVPTNFFGQADTRHVSAILFSNAGTMAKFNRMGVLAGFGDPDVKLRRKGGFNDPTPGAFDEIPFEMNIEDPDYAERWADEIEIYHNPDAAVPLHEEIFEGTTQFFLEEGEFVWRGPSPRVLYSSTMSVALKD